MSALSAHVSAFMLLNFGKVEHEGHLKAHANAIADLGAQAKVLFPAGTDTGDTDALPLIWKEQEQFKKLLTDLETSSGEAAGRRGSPTTSPARWPRSSRWASPARAATTAIARRTTD